MREADPPGERYALSKVLHTCQVGGWVGGWVQLPGCPLPCMCQQPRLQCSAGSADYTLPCPSSPVAAAFHHVCPAITPLPLQSPRCRLLQGDLHAIFLHYCLLDAGFARHWPPQLTLQGWLGLMKDVGSTNPVPGTRTRSDNTMHVRLRPAAAGVRAGGRAAWPGWVLLRFFLLATARC